MMEEKKCEYCNSKAGFFDGGKIVCWRCGGDNTEPRKGTELQEVLIKLGELDFANRDVAELEGLKEKINNVIKFIDNSDRVHKNWSVSVSPFNSDKGKSLIEYGVKIKKILEKK